MYFICTVYVLYMLCSFFHAGGYLQTSKIDVFLMRLSLDVVTWAARSSNQLLGNQLLKAGTATKLYVIYIYIYQDGAHPSYKFVYKPLRTSISYSYIYHKP